MFTLSRLTITLMIITVVAVTAAVIVTVVFTNKKESFRYQQLSTLGFHPQPSNTIQPRSSFPIHNYLPYHTANVRMVYKTPRTTNKVDIATVPPKQTVEVSKRLIDTHLLMGQRPVIQIDITDKKGRKQRYATYKVTNPTLTSLHIGQTTSRLDQSDPAKMWFNMGSVLPHVFIHNHTDSVLRLNNGIAGRSNPGITIPPHGWIRYRGREGRGVNLGLRLRDMDLVHEDILLSRLATDIHIGGVYEQSQGELKESEVNGPVPGIGVVTEPLPRIHGGTFRENNPALPVPA